VKSLVEFIGRNPFNSYARSDFPRHEDIIVVEGSQTSSFPLGGSKT